MPETIVMVGTFDSKGAEYATLRDFLLDAGGSVLAVDVGILGSTDLFPVHITAETVAAAGGSSLDELRRRNDRGHAIAVMSAGAAKVLRNLHAQGTVAGVIGMGGSGGTGIVTAAMRALPFGVPKVCLSTLAAGDVASFLGEKEIVMMPAIADLAGVNRITRVQLAQAAGAVVGMMQARSRQTQSEQTQPLKPLIVASMFGNTTPCINRCRELLETQEFETLVFHATGFGGRVMESLIRDGEVTGVLDLTTTEWADELCGGVLSAGPDRLRAAAETGVPQVIAPGCLDMCNFRGLATVPQHYRDAGRLFYEWTPEITLMRTSPSENRRLGEIFGERANTARGPVAFLIPRQGFSLLGSPGEPFHDPAADRAFVEGLRSTLNPDIPIEELDLPINAPPFAERAVSLLQGMLERVKQS